MSEQLPLTLVDGRTTCDVEVTGPHKNTPAGFWVEPWPGQFFDVVRVFTWDGFDVMDEVGHEAEVEIRDAIRNGEAV
jgi:hypothetical protein